MINIGFKRNSWSKFLLRVQERSIQPFGPWLHQSYGNNPAPGSNPEVISRTVLKIINARNPKTRYLVGRGGKLLVGIRRIFGDKFFDRMMLMSMR